MNVFGFGITLPGARQAPAVHGPRRRRGAAAPKPARPPCWRWALSAATIRRRSNSPGKWESRLCTTAFAARRGSTADRRRTAKEQCAEVLTRQQPAPAPCGAAPAAARSDAACRHRRARRRMARRSRTTPRLRVPAYSASGVGARPMNGKGRGSITWLARGEFRGDVQGCAGRSGRRSTRSNWKHHIGDEALTGGWKQWANAVTGRDETDGGRIADFRFAGDGTGRAYQTGIETWYRPRPVIHLVTPTSDQLSIVEYLGARYPYPWDAKGAPVKRADELRYLLVVGDELPTEVGEKIKLESSRRRCRSTTSGQSSRTMPATCARARDALRRLPTTKQQPQAPDAGRRHRQRPPAAVRRSRGPKSPRTGLGNPRRPAQTLRRRCRARGLPS